MTIECYAQRLLDPFRGTMLTIRHGAAEAVSLDGVRWDIYVANDLLRDGVAARGEVQVSDIRYGSWSRETGLKRGSIYPSEDFKRMEALGAVVYQHLLHVHALGLSSPEELRDEVADLQRRATAACTPRPEALAGGALR